MLAVIYNKVKDLWKYENPGHNIDYKYFNVSQLGFHKRSVVFHER